MEHINNFYSVQRTKKKKKTIDIKQLKNCLQKVHKSIAATIKIL